MKDELPATADESKELAKEYPHTKDDITKKVLSAKLKTIRGKFREAVDSGHQSGHGRVVLLYYELCEKVWGGSPATQQLDTGIESTDLNDVTDPTPSPTGSSGNGEADESTRNDSIVELTDEGQRQEQTVNSRRQYLDRKLSGHKTEKMKRKLPIGVQVLACAKEDLAVKKRLVEQMDKFDKEYSESMQILTSNMEKIGNSIAEGFNVLKHLIGPQPSYPYPPPIYNPHQPHPNTFDMNMSFTRPYESPSTSPSPHPPTCGSSNYTT